MEEGSHFGAPKVNNGEREPNKNVNALIFLERSSLISFDSSSLSVGEGNNENESSFFHSSSSFFSQFKF